MVIYLLVAVVVTASTARLIWRALAWTAVVVMPAAVGFARVYRGMHHPTDVLAGALMGVAVLAVALVAVRAAKAASAPAHAGGRSLSGSRGSRPRRSPRGHGLMGAPVAVVAHQQKVLGGGLPELRRQLASAGIDDPAWFEVPKSKKAPKRVRQAIDEGAELLLVWGGDGMVQRCIDAIVDHDVTLGILPAGTANLLATNLGIPHELEGALEVALRGRDRPVDVATVNGEHFAVMSGLGFDAQMIEGADSAAKEKLGKLAYVRTGVGAMRSAPVKLRIKVDGTKWFKGDASCVLVGNVGTASGGLVVFSDAELDDGVLEIGVVTAEGTAQWLRVLGRAARKQADQSPFVHTTRGKKVDVRLDKASLYELDGGSRSKVKRLRYRVKHHAITVRVPS